MTSTATAAPPRLRRLLRAAEALTTPVLAERYVQLVDPLFSIHEARARVVAVRDETPGVVTVELRPGPGWRTHRAGQHVRLGVDVNGVRQWRTFTLSSPPERADGLLAVTVKALPGGRVTPWLRGGLQVGTVVRLDGPYGDFVLPDCPGPLLLVTGGSGITPALAMLRSLAARSAMPDVVHVHAARSARDVIARDELHALAARCPTYTLHEHLDDETDGQLTPARLTAMVPDALQRTAYVCGPPPMRDALEHHWVQAGNADRFHCERFTVAPAAAAPGEGGTATFTQSGVDVVADGATSLLDAGEAAGALLPSGCRMGICFSCVGVLRSGAVRDLRDGTVRDTPGETVQTCVNAPSGACAIDL